MTAQRDDEVALRPAEALRARVIETLSVHFANDQLTVEQLEERIDRAYAARTASELRSVLSGLPALEPPPPSPSSAKAAAPDASSDAPARKTLFALLGGFARRGTWVVPRRINAIAILGGIEIDLRDAQIPPEGVEIKVFALLGGVAVKVPDDVRLESDGVAILGGFEDQVRGASPDARLPALAGLTGITIVSGDEDEPRRRTPAHATAPLVRVTGVAILGGVEAKVSRR